MPFAAHVLQGAFTVDAFLQTPQGAIDGFAFLQSDLSQLYSLPLRLDGMPDRRPPPADSLCKMEAQTSPPRGCVNCNLGNKMGQDGSKCLTECARVSCCLTRFFGELRARNVSSAGRT